VNSRRLPGECSARALYRETVRRAFNNRSNLFLALLRDKARETPLGSARLGSAWLARARVVTLRVLARFTERSVARKQCRRRLVERERERGGGGDIRDIDGRRRGIFPRAITGANGAVIISSVDADSKRFFRRENDLSLELCRLYYGRDSRLFTVCGTPER